MLRSGSVSRSKVTGQGQISAAAVLGARQSHYQSKVFVCVSNNRTDAVDRTKN